MASYTPFKALLLQTRQQLRENRALITLTTTILLFLLLLRLPSYFYPAQESIGKGGGEVRLISNQILYSGWNICWYLLLMFLTTMFLVGCTGEMFHAAPARIHRALREGAKRFRQIFYFIIVYLLFFPVGPGLSLTPLPDIMVITGMVILTIFFALFYGFALPAAAVGPPSQGFLEFLRNTFTALGRGWLKLLLFYFLLCVVIFCFYLTVLLPLLLFTLVEIHFIFGIIGNELGLIWIFTAILLLLYSWTFSLCFAAKLYADVSGLQPPSPETAPGQTKPLP